MNLKLQEFETGSEKDRLLDGDPDEGIELGGKNNGGVSERYKIYVANKDDDDLDSLEHSMADEEESGGVDVPVAQSLEPYQSGSDDGSNSVQHSVPNLERYCTLDSLSSMQNSSSTASFSPDGSPVSQQNYTYPLDLHHSPENTCATPVSGSCVIDNENDLGLMVRH
ncbi:hypothetical protein GOBAR_DD20771 [Gossypium barbadense]|nr:hypothetical protein GOBAR_DD20771 [Gossypium barbadense]